MTVSELIEKLKTFPADTPVIYRRYSDWNELEGREIELVLASERKVIWREGGYRDMYHPGVWPEGEVPQYVTVVAFPGN